MTAKDLRDAIAAMTNAHELLIKRCWCLSHAQIYPVSRAMLDARASLERALENIPVEIEP